VPAETAAEPAVPFYRVSGAGNDFLALVEPARVPPAGTIAAWCRRGVSLGADGLFVLRRAGCAGMGAAVAMDHFNADGGPAELCVNGTRCAARLVFHLGWFADEVEVRTGAGPVRARAAGDDVVALELPAPGEPEALSVELPEAEGGRVEGWRVTVGVPHFVVLPTDLARAPVAALGPPLRRHRAFGAAGTNVDFVRFPAPGRLEVRTFERGVEAETLACGTGVLAAAAVGRATGALALPATALTTGGFEMTVGEAGGGRWTLAGDARIVAAGEALPGAAAVPEPLRWTPGR